MLKLVPFQSSRRGKFCDNAILNSNFIRFYFYLSNEVYNISVPQGGQYFRYLQWEYENLDKGVLQIVQIGSKWKKSIIIRICFKSSSFPTLGCPLGLENFKS